MYKNLLKLLFTLPWFIKSKKIQVHLRARSQYILCTISLWLSLCTFIFLSLFEYLSSSPSKSFCLNIYFPLLPNLSSSLTLNLSSCLSKSLSFSLTLNIPLPLLPNRSSSLTLNLSSCLSKSLSFCHSVPLSSSLSKPLFYLSLTLSLFLPLLPNLCRFVTKRCVECDFPDTFIFII